MGESRPMASNERRGGWRWAWLVVLAVGCSGDGMIASTGSVSYDGQLVADGAISFHPLEATIAPQGGQIAAGRFSVRTRPGRYRVEILATRPQAGGVELTPGAKPREQYIPARYNAESTLEAEVKPQGPNTFTFTLGSQSQ
jgi:hypothetical protein